MKKLNPFLTMTLLLIAMSILVSCTSSKTAINCPTLPRSNSNPKASSNFKKLDKKVFAYSQRKPTKTRNTKTLYVPVRRSDASPAQSVSNLDIITNKSEDPYFETFRMPTRLDYNKSLLASTDDSRLSVELVLPIAEASINSTSNANLTATKVKSKRENTFSTINNSMNMSFENTNSRTNPILTDSFPQDSPQKNEGFGLAGFIISLVGLLVAFLVPLGLLFGLIPIIFGTISLVKIKRNPAKYKGRGFALWSLLLGIIGLALGWIVTISYIGD